MLALKKLITLIYLVGQNNIGKSTLLQSIELLISGNDSNRYITENTKVRFSFCPEEDDIKLVFRDNMYGGHISGNHWDLGKNILISVCLMTFSLGKL
ncbi:hypothetical protein [Streptococcus thermophilus]|uniref:hypothetical protein n=1 Tax=Streptococcus thermophilus TaxID=1308 RepID=UPI0031017265